MSLGGSNEGTGRRGGVPRARMEHTDACEGSRGLVRLEAGRECDGPENMRRSRSVTETLEPGRKLDAKVRVFSELEGSSSQSRSLIETPVTRREPPGQSGRRLPFARLVAGGARHVEPRAHGAFHRGWTALAPGK